MGVLDWLRRLLGSGQSTPRPSLSREERFEQLQRRRDDFLPTARRKTPHRKRYRRPEAQYSPDQLDRFDLPRIATTADLARALGITDGKLRWLAWPRTSKTDDHYVRWQVAKASGGKRMLCKPKAQTRAAQDWIFKEVLSRVPVSSAAHGFIKGRSIVTNAEKHAGKQIVLNVDLEDFFPAISVASVIGLFEWMGYSKDIAWFLGMLCTCSYRRGMSLFGGYYRRRRALPQGSPTSPAIANLVCWKLDRRLEGLAAKLGADYTRYADDLTFSGGADLAAASGRFLGYVHRICDEEGFRVNPRKTRIMRKRRRQVVTGLTVNEKPNVSREEIRSLRAILHNCRVQGVESQNRDDDPQFAERLRGKIAMIRMVNPEKADKLQAQFDAVTWE